MAWDIYMNTSFPGKLLIIPSNVRLGWKCLTVTSAPGLLVNYKGKSFII